MDMFKKIFVFILSVVTFFLALATPVAFLLIGVVEAAGGDLTTSYYHWLAFIPLVIVGFIWIVIGREWRSL
jgi:hypothetical protein